MCVLLSVAAVVSCTLMTTPATLLLADEPASPTVWDNRAKANIANERATQGGTHHGEFP